MAYESVDKTEKNIKNMEESREQKLHRLEKGKFTIYHELGHLFGYILANANEATVLGKVKECSIGLHKNCVIPEKYIYHMDNMPTDTEDPDYNDRLKEEKNKIKNNTKNLPRTLAWVCEVLLGCITQCTVEKVKFTDCYGAELRYGERKIGYKDSINISHMNHGSAYRFDISFFELLRRELEEFVRSKNIVDKLKPFVERIQNKISETDDFQKTYEGDDLELLYNSVSEILDDDMKMSYLEMINKHSDKLRLLHSS